MICQKTNPQGTKTKTSEIKFQNSRIAEGNLVYYDESLKSVVKFKRIGDLWEIDGKQVDGTNISKTIHNSDRISFFDLTGLLTLPAKIYDLGEDETMKYEQPIISFERMIEIKDAKFEITNTDGLLLIKFDTDQEHYSIKLKFEGERLVNYVKEGKLGKTKFELVDKFT